jgi:hypothetical protein
MALIKCRECKNEVSTSAKTCPKCGAKVKKPHSVIGGIFAVIFVVLMIGLISAGGEKPPQSAETVAKPAAASSGALASVEPAGPSIPPVGSPDRWAKVGQATAPAPGKPDKSPQQAALDNKRADEDAEDMFRVCAIYKSMHNPASLKLIKAVRTTSGELCVQYRATNAFNATVTEAVRFASLPSQAEPRRVSSCESLQGRDQNSLSYNLYLCK